MWFKISKIERYFKKIKPDVIFHLASDADVKSFIEPYKIIQNNNLITLNLLEAIRVLKFDPIIQICSTSEVYGNVEKIYADKWKLQFATK